MRSPGEIVRHIVTGEIVGDVDIPGISAVDSIGSMRLAKPLWTQSHDRGAGLGTGIGMGDWNPFLPVIYSSAALLLGLSSCGRVGLKRVSWRPRH
jgi:hypothetical protein